MSAYDGAVFVHVAAAITLVSSSVIISPRLRTAIRHAASTQEIRSYVTVGRPLHLLEPVSGVAVLITGIYLTTVANFWALGWVQISVVCWLLNAVIAGVVVNPVLVRLAAMTATPIDGAIAPGLDATRRSGRWVAAGDALAANDAAMVYLMTMKPELAASVLVVVASNAVVSSLRSMRRSARRHTPAAARSS